MAFKKTNVYEKFGTTGEPDDLDTYNEDFSKSKNTENIDTNDKKTEIPVGVSCRTCDRLDCSQRAFPPLHKKFDVDINNRGVSVYVNE